MLKLNKSHGKVAMACCVEENVQLTHERTLEWNKTCCNLVQRSTECLAKNVCAVQDKFPPADSALIIFFLVAVLAIICSYEDFRGA